MNYLDNPCDSYGEPRGANRTYVKLERPTAAHLRKVREWFAAWEALTERQQDAWHAMTRDERDATKQLSAQEFTELMNGK